MEKSPAFPFYPRDYVSDLNVRAMTYEQRGVYVELLGLCWLEGGIPADVGELARVLGLSQPRLVRLWPPIERCFYLAGEKWQHKRLDAERAKAAAHRAERSASGKAGAEKRWHGRAPAPEAKREAPAKVAFDGKHLRVWTWQHDELARLLGQRPFDLIGWYPQLDAEIGKGGDSTLNDPKGLRDRFYTAAGIDRPNLFGKARAPRPGVDPCVGKHNPPCSTVAECQRKTQEYLRA